MPRDTASKKSCDQCLATTTNNTRCKRRVCHGNLCWSHAQKYLKLRIKPSPIGGKGLFAQKINKKATDTVFKKNERIAEYIGKFRTSMSGKFDDYTLNIGRNKYIDAYRTNHGFARYVNDCRKTGKKCNAELVVNARTNSGYVRAKKKIKDGEEILASYGKEYWRGYNGGNKRNAESEEEESALEFEDVDIPFQSTTNLPVYNYEDPIPEIIYPDEDPRSREIYREINSIKSQARQKRTKKGIQYNFTREESNRIDTLKKELFDLIMQHSNAHNDWDDNNEIARRKTLTLTETERLIELRTEYDRIRSQKELNDGDGRSNYYTQEQANRLRVLYKKIEDILLH